MISKLPRWVWGGAWVLAFIAGMVNAVGILGLEHQSVSHLTGTTTLLGIGIAQGDTGKVVHFLLLLGAFLVGTALSGLLIEDTALKLGPRYPLALLLEAALLTSAAFLLRNQHVPGHYLASCACGLQNAMITTYSGIVVRTTHVSGMFTDLGISLGHALRRHLVDFRRVRLSGIVITGFLCGAAAGAAGFSRLGPFPLLIPAGVTAFVAVAYGWRTMRGRSQDDSPPSEHSDHGSESQKPRQHSDGCRLGCPGVPRTFHGTRQHALPVHALGNSSQIPVMEFPADAREGFAAGCW